MATITHGPGAFNPEALPGNRWLRPVASAEKHAVAEQMESGSSVQLALDHPRLAVDALGAAVVPGQGEDGGGGLDVKAEAPGEGAQAGQVSLAGIHDPRASPAGDHQSGRRAWRGRGAA